MPRARGPQGPAGVQGPKGEKGDTVLGTGPAGPDGLQRPKAAVLCPPVCAASGRAAPVGGIVDGDQACSPTIYAWVRYIRGRRFRPAVR